MRIKRSFRYFLLREIKEVYRCQLLSCEENVSEDGMISMEYVRTVLNQPIREFPLIWGMALEKYREQ